MCQNFITKKRRKNIQNRLNLSVKDYKEYSETLIEIEIIPVKGKYGEFIKVDENDKLYYNIYFNDNKENGIITAREKKDKMKLFGYDIKNKRQPGINEKLKNERMLLIRSLDNPKLAVKSSHKILFQKYKKFTDNINNESNKKNIIVKEKENNSLSHKRSKKRLFPLHPKPNIKIDYLTEMIAQKEKKKKKERSLVILQIN